MHYESFLEISAAGIQLLRHYATNRNIASSITDEVNFFKRT
jgi:hypothetical protein